MMDCDYKDDDDILVDCIIDGVHDKKLQGRLLEKGEALTLAQAIETGQHFELSQKQLRIVRDESEIDVNVSTIGKRMSRQDRPAGKEKTGFRDESEIDVNASAIRKKMSRQDRPAGKGKTEFCFRCGGDPKHSQTRGNCPAMGTTCAHCRKPNHWRKVCRRRRGLHAIETDSESDPEVLMVHSTKLKDSKDSDKWNQIVSICGKNIKIKIDTVARCNTLTVRD